MISRRLLLVLVTSHIVLIVAFSVLAGAGTLAGALEDRFLSGLLRSLAMACLTLFAINAIVLVGALGLQAAFPPAPPDEPGRSE